MSVLSNDFADKIRLAWGNTEKVARIGIIETFNHDNFDFDRDSVGNAIRIGVLAGRTADKNPEAFIEGFTALLDK